MLYYVFFTVVQLSDPISGAWTGASSLGCTRLGMLFGVVLESVLFMVTQCTQCFRLSQDEMRNASMKKKKVQMEIVICYHSIINIVSR